MSCGENSLQNNPNTRVGLILTTVSIVEHTNRGLHMGSKTGFCHGMYEEAIMCEAMDKGFKQSYWLKALKLVPKAFRQESPRPKKKSGKLRQNLHSTCFGGKNQSVWTQKKNNPTQGFNLLQFSPNWFLGNWTLWTLVSKGS